MRSLFPLFDIDLVIIMIKYYDKLNRVNIEINIACRITTKTSNTRHTRNTQGVQPKKFSKCVKKPNLT